MRSTLSLPPPRSGAFLAGLGCEVARLLRIGSAPIRQVVPMLCHRVLNVGTIQAQIFKAIVTTLAIQVVDSLLRLKQPAQVLLHHESVLEHVTVSVRLWMLRGVGVNVARSMHVSASAPSVIVRSRLDVVAGNVSQMVAAVVATPCAVALGYRRRLAAAAPTLTARVRRGINESALVKHRACRFSSGPMALQESPAGSW